MKDLLRRIPRPANLDVLLPRPPFWLIAIAIVAVVASWVPLVLIARARVTLDDKPRVHIFQDMDVQPKYGAQDPSPVFADNRAMRPLVPGTVARGELFEDDHLYRGFTLERNDETGEWVTEYFDGFPEQIDITEELLLRGQKKFEIYCVQCHGWTGQGNGPTMQRAVELGESWGRLASNITAEQYLPENYPDGRMYTIISNGVRTMPAYGPQINVEDRWAVVAYVRALQLSQNATLDDVPPDVRPTLR